MTIINIYVSWGNNLCTLLSLLFRFEKQGIKISIYKVLSRWYLLFINKHMIYFCFEQNRHLDTFMSYLVIQVK